MKRVFDLVLSIILFALFFPLMLVLAILVRVTSKGPAIHWSKRTTQNNRIFLMPKFRSMYTNTPNVATHLLKNTSSHITPLGSFLRKSSLDELPQLISIIKGEMSFVGPRPALFNQHDLIELRTKSSVDIIKPGITGWAQINGRDEISIQEKVILDEYYLRNQNFLFDIKIILLTISKVFFSRGVSH